MVYYILWHLTIIHSILSDLVWITVVFQPWTILCSSCRIYDTFYVLWLWKWKNELDSICMFHVNLCQKKIKMQSFWNQGIYLSWIKFNKIFDSLNSEVFEGQRIAIWIGWIIRNWYYFDALKLADWDVFIILAVYYFASCRTTNAQLWFNLIYF